MKYFTNCKSLDELKAEFRRLVKIEFRRKADAEEDVPPDGVLFPGDELVPVVFRNVGGKEDVLLQYSFVSEFGSHVFCERSRPGQQVIHVIPEKCRQLLRTDRQDPFIQPFFDFPVSFVQPYSPFL